MTVLADITESVTSKERVESPTLPSVTLVFVTEIVGEASSSRMVPVPEPARTFAFVSFDRSTVKVSSDSWVTSPFTVMSTVFAV